MSELKSLKVLASVFAFSPVKGSEFGIGWDYVRAIAARHKVWAIARENEKEETEAYLRRHPDEMTNIEAHYISWTDMKFNFPLWEIPHSLMMRQWQRRAYQVARDLDRIVDFDIVQHITATGFREPGFLWKLGKPFIWGPIGGLQYFPSNLLGAVPPKSRIFFVAKNISTYWAMHFSRRPRQAAKKAALVIAGTSEAAERIRRLWAKNAPVLCEVNAPETTEEPPLHRSSGDKFRIVWSGSFEPRKALNLVLLALMKLRRSISDWELICLGGGPLEKSWKELAKRCEIEDRCRFLGKLPRAEAVSEMSRGHCFVQPSLYDATSSVVVEALAMGLPVVCLDHFGFRDAVNPSCGIRISPRSVKQIVNDFATALELLARDEDLRYQLAIGAKKASKQLTWKNKEQVLNELFSEVTSDPSQEFHARQTDKSSDRVATSGTE